MELLEAANLRVRIRVQSTVSVNSLKLLADEAMLNGCAEQVPFKKLPSLLRKCSGDDNQTEHAPSCLRTCSLSYGVCVCLHMVVNHHRQIADADQSFKRRLRVSFMTL